MGLVGAPGADPDPQDRADSDENLVDVAPAPVLVGLGALDQGMVRDFEVLARVLVLGRVTATHMAAGKTHPQVNPGVAHREALFAAA
jgi:hypothetical protein